MNGIDDLPAPWSIEEVHSYSFEIRYKNEVLDTRKTYNNAMTRAKRMVKAQAIMRKAIDRDNTGSIT